jgi:hypothetical protein
MSAKADYGNRERNAEVVPGFDEVKSFATKRRFLLYHSVLTLLKPICAMIDVLEGDSYPTLSLVQALALGISRICSKMKHNENSKQSPSETFIKILDRLEAGLAKRFLYKPLEHYKGQFLPIYSEFIFRLYPHRLCNSCIGSPNKAFIFFAKQ